MKACAKHHVIMLAGYTLALITDFFYFALFVTTLIPLKVAGFKQTCSKGFLKRISTFLIGVTKLSICEALWGLQEH